MPNSPSNPPNGTYTSTCGTDFSTWDGSFTYTDGAIEYTLASNPTEPYSSDNKSNGNAIVFDLTVGTETVQFNGSSFAYQPGDKAQYSGNCHKLGPAANQDGWTATQTS
jgi:hypothetical protein